MKLSPKQARFVEEYLIDLNATRAAIRAGYSEKTANEQGARLLANVSVAQAIAAAKSARSERTEISADRVLQELAAVGFASLGDFVTVDDDGQVRLDFSRADLRAVAEIKQKAIPMGEDGSGPVVLETTFKLHRKVPALVKLGDHLGLFPKTVKHDVADPLAALLDDISDTSRGLPTDGGGDD